MSRKLLIVVASMSICFRGPAAADDAQEVAGGSGLMAGPAFPLTGLFGSSLAQEYIPTEHRFNFDISAGPYIPIEGPESLDVGGTFDMKFQGEVVRYLFLGAEFAYAGEGKDSGRVWSEGTLHRFFLLVPLEVDLPFAGEPENPFSVRLGLAPGIQIVDPEVDPDLEDLLRFNDLDLHEEALVAFNVRARVGVRLPIDPHFGFIIETAFDWSEGHARARLTDFLSGTEERIRKYVNLSGVSVLFGLQFVW
jgi:hypothetical protein